MSGHEWWSVHLNQHNTDGTCVQQSWVVDESYAASMRDHMGEPDLSQLFSPDEVERFAGEGGATLYATKWPDS